ncbi:MAG: phage major capsid protein [Pelagibacterium sp.]|uniref:phage major capsid protein n=1 Tax=Pelagibacterium sp. TaxID=1967288 RepID=UPI0032F090F6
MPEMNDERVHTRTVDLHVRNLDEETGIIEGYASRWNEADAYGDVIEPGAFAETISRHRSAGTMPAMLWLHREPAGVWEVIEERSDGLFVRGRFALDTSTGREAFAHAKAGTTTGLSIGFQYIDFEIDNAGVWHVKAVDLHEISLTPIPAAPRARITNVRQIGAPMPEQIQTPEAPASSAPVETRSAPQTQQRNAELETRLAAMQTRMDELEISTQRVPATPRGESEQRDIELRALASFIRTGDDTEIRSAVSSNNADGGYFILPTVDSTIRNMLEDVSPIRSLAENVTISGNTYERFYSTGNRGAQWVAEQTERPQDTGTPKLIKHSYGVRELYAAPTATRQLVDDASFDVAGWFNQWVANDMALAEGEAFWTGDGVDGKPRGILTHPIVATADATRDWGSIQYIPAGHASAPTDDNLAKALVALVLTLHRRYGNRRLVTTSANYIRFRQLQDTAKRFLWAATGNLLESAENGSILGVPVVIDESLDDIEVGAGANIAAVADFSQAYVVVNRHGLRVERDAVTKKGWITYDSYMRVGGGLGDSRAIKVLKIAAA